VFLRQLAIGQPASPASSRNASPNGSGLLRNRWVLARSGPGGGSAGFGLSCADYRRPMARALMYSTVSPLPSTRRVFCASSREVSPRAAINARSASADGLLVLELTACAPRGCDRRHGCAVRIRLMAVAASTSVIVMAQNHQLLV
jgi:hypothetical protein